VNETWERLQMEARNVMKQEETKSIALGSLTSFGLRKLIEERVLSHTSFREALSATIGTKLTIGAGDDTMDYQGMALCAMNNDPSITEAACCDLDRFLIMDPAADGMLKIYLFYKGFHAVQCARIAHNFWHQQNNQWIASALQSDMSDKFGVDIHPAAKWGKGITMDHGTGCVIGETSVIGDNVYLMHGVTLGATGTSNDHDRHPKIGHGAFLAANSTILGNITIGDGATVGAQALVLKDVPSGYTAVGAPARFLPPAHMKNKPKVAPSGAIMPASEYKYEFTDSPAGRGMGV